MARLLRSDETWVRYPSMAECARQLGLSPACVYRSCGRKVNDARGYELKFEETPELVGEVWRAALDPVTGAALPWEVSSLGRIKNSRGIPTYGTPHLGYMRAAIWSNGKRRAYLVHR